jgi:hypothetical protein
MVNFYRWFLPGIARTLQPLTDTLKGAPRRWSGRPPPLPPSERPRPPWRPRYHWRTQPQTPCSLSQQTPLIHTAGVLQQLNSGRWQPLAFYSKKLSGAGTRYSTFDRELLAAFSTVRHFRFLLEGRQFRQLTDHKPLVTSLFRTTPPWSARQQQQLSFIAEFTSDIRHTPGQENVVADALSGCLQQPRSHCRRASDPLPLSPPRTGRKRGWQHQNGPFWLPSPMRSRSTFQRWPLRSRPARRWRR